MWYAGYDKNTKRLYSIGTVIAKVIPDNFVVIELGEDFDPDTKAWDETLLNFINYVPPVIKTKLERINEILGAVNLTKIQELAIKRKLEELM